MANTPQRNMRIRPDLWEKVENEASSKEAEGGPKYPRTWVVNAALAFYFKNRGESTP